MFDLITMVDAEELLGIEKYLQMLKDYLVGKFGDVTGLGDLIKEGPLWFYGALVFILGISALISAVGMAKKFKTSVDEKISGSRLGAVKEKRRLMSEASKMASKKNYGRAAEIYLSMEEETLAAEVLIKGGLYAKAGQLYEKMGKLDKAIELYTKAGEDVWLAEAYKKKNDYGKSGDIYLKVGKKLLAAEAYEKAEMAHKAAPLYEEAGHTQTAARLYEQAKDYKKAAILYERAYTEGTSTQEVQTPDKMAKLTEMSMKAGTYFEQSGEHEKAAESFARCKSFDRAAGAALRAGKREQAAAHYAQGKHYDQAAAIYQEDGNERKASEVLAEKFMGEGDELQAARMFMKAGDHMKAAELFDQVGQYVMSGDAYSMDQEYAAAAEMYIKGGDKAKAAEAYVKGDWPKRAAELYLELGDSDRASSLVEKSGDFYTAAELYRKMNNPDKELAALQKVSADDQRYNSTIIRLAEIFNAQGNSKLAGEKYAQAISGAEPDQTNVDLFYGLASVYEADGRFDEATLLFQKVQLVDFRYKDVEERIKACAAAAQARQETKTTAKVAPSPDDAVKRYKIIKEVGRGGMGVVYQANDNNLNRVIALKLLPKNISENPTMIKRFAAEARSAAQLMHTNIVTLYDFQQVSGRSFLTMEFVEGSTLKKLITTHGKLPIVNALKIVYQCCQGLDYAHKKGIIHRDIKPANIMVNTQSVVKIMDFGLAKIIGEETLTEAGSISGTVMYMSPEQLRGDPLDSRTDLYSLGLVLYELLAGKHPFSEGDAAYHHVHTKPKPPKELRPEIPDSLNAIVLKCLEKDRDNRFESALKMAMAMREVSLK